MIASVHLYDSFFDVATHGIECICVVAADFDLNVDVGGSYRAVYSQIACMCASIVVTLTMFLCVEQTVADGSRNSSSVGGGISRPFV